MHARPFNAHGVFFLLLLLAGSLSFSTDVGTCSQLSTPDTYTLNTSLSGANLYSTGNFACIFITASNVVLDCQGYAIDRNAVVGTPAGILVNNSVSNVTVKNCPNILNYYDGIYVRSSNNNLFTNITVNGGYPEAGIYVNSSQNNAFTNVVVNGSYDGVYVNAGSSNNFTNVSAVNGSHSGFVVMNSDTNRFVSCNATNNQYVGFSVVSGEFNYLLYSYANRNQDGFYLDNLASYNIIQHDISFNNTRYGFAFTQDSSHNAIYNNSARLAQKGFYFEGSTDDNIANNSARDTSSYSFHFDTSCDNNLFTDNNATNPATSAIVLDASSGNVISGNRVANATSYGFYLNGNSNYNNLTNNSVSNASTCFSLQSGANNRVVNSSAVLCSSTGYSIYGSSYNLLTASSVTGSGGFPQYGIYLYLVSDYNNVTFNTITGSMYGIYMSDCYNRDNFTSNSISNTSYGIYIQTNGADFYYNNVTNSSLYGFYSTSSGGSNMLVGNRIWLTNGSAVYLGTSGNILRNNLAYNNTNGFEVPQYFLPTTNNAFTNNSAYQNSWAGFLLNRTRGQNLSNNTAYGNIFGIWLFDTNQSRLLNNSVHDNSYGIIATSYNNAVTGDNISGNNISNNAQAGVYLESQVSYWCDALLTDNLIVANYYGIWLPTGYFTANLSNNTVANSTVSGYQYDNYFGGNIIMNRDTFRGNPTDVSFPSGASALTISVSDVMFGNAAGAYGVNASLNHSTSSRTWGILDWVPSPAPPSSGLVSFLNKSLNVTPNRLEFSGNYDITMKWNSTEGGSSLRQSSIQMWLTNSTGNYLLNATPDVPGRSIFASVALTENDSVISLFFNDGCPIITVPGAYTLDKNLSGAPNAGSNGYNACVLITSDDVYLDCAGYNITHDGSANTAGIMVNGTNSGFSNITIRNCNVRDYESAILIDNINPYFKTVNVTGNNLTDNDNGVFIPNGYAKAVMSDNLVANNSGAGYSLNNYFADTINVTRDRFLGNGDDFSYPSGMSSLTISLRDVILGDASGQYPTNVSVSHATSSRTHGVIDWVPSPSPPSGRLVFLNKSFNLTQALMDVEHGFSFSISWNSSEGAPAQWNRVELWLINDSGSYLLNNTPDTGNRKISANINMTTASSSVASLFLANPNCPVVNGSGTYIQTDNFTGAPNVINGFQNVCVLINASNVDWNCNGSTILNNGTDTSFGVYVNGPLSNITIRNCPNVSGYVYGVYVYNSTGVSVRNVTAGGSFQSAFASPYSPVLFDNDTAYGSGNGFYVSSNNNVTNCTAVNNTNGYYLDGGLSTGIRFINDTAALSGNYGFFSTSGANGNYFGFSRAFNSTNDGFYINSNGNNLSNNTAYYNGNAGFSVSGTGNMVDNNSAYNNTEGIRLNAGPNTAFNNDVQDNPGFGFISTGNGNNITGNRGVRNGYGVDVSSCSGNVISSNNFSSGSTGIAVIASTTTSISDNNVFGNSGNGFYLSNSNGTTVSDDHVYANQYAFYIQGTAAAASVNLSNVIIDRAAGDFANYTNLSLNDSVSAGSAYRINWTTNSSSPGAAYTSLLGKFVSISTVSGSVSLDSIVWHYLESDIGALDEDRFVIMKYNGSWSDTGATLDTGSNTLALANMVPSSDYGIFEGPASCPVISSPGTTTQAQNYVGSPNVVSGGLACVVINADNIDYDCNGYNITGNGSGPSTFGIISDFHRNITIRNCPGISNYSWGVEFLNNNDSFILNTTSFNNTYYGFWITTVMPANGSNRNLIANNTAYDNDYSGFFVSGYYNNLTNNTDTGGDGYGIWLAGGANNRLVQNRISNHPTSRAIYLDNSSYNLLQDSRVSTSSYGIMLASGSTGNQLNANNATSNSNAGIYLNSCPANNLTGNIVNATTTNGIQITGSSSCLVFNNTAYGNGNYGFLLEAGSANNTVLSNTAHHNTFEGFSAASSAGNNFTNNLAYSNLRGFTAYGIASTGNLFANNTARNHSSNGFLFAFNASNNLVTNNSAYWNMDGFTLETGAGNNLFTFNNGSNNSQYGFASLGANNNNFTNNTAYYNSNMGFYLQSCSGNRIANNTAISNAAYGIGLTTATLNSVMANRVSGGTQGIHLESSSDRNLVDNNNVSSNALYGVTISFCQQNNVTNNTVNTNGQYGVYLIGATNNLFLNNTVVSNVQHGFYLASGSNYNRFIGNNASSHTGIVDSSGFYAGGSSSYNRFDNNSAISNHNGFYITSGCNYNNFTSNNASLGWRGFQLTATSFDRLVGNTANGNTLGPGIVMVGAISLLLENNTASGNTQYGIDLITSTGNNLTGNDAESNNQGIRLESSSDGNLVDLNTVQSNTNFGILVLNSQQNNVTRNNASLNNYGIYVSASNNRVLGNNASSNAQTGIYVTGSGSSYNLVADNIASSNTNYGIHVSSGANNYNNLTNNTANLNNDGMRVEASQFCMLRNNFAGNNANNGFYVGTAAHNTLLDNNTATGNANHGFYLVTSDSCNLTGNTAYNNTQDGFSVSSGSGDTLTLNTAYDNVDGIYLSGANAVLTSNTAYLNHNNGFTLGGATGATLANNTAYGNTFIGFEENAAASDNLISNSTAYNSMRGFVVQSLSARNNLTGVSAFNNSDRGIHVLGNRTLVANAHLFNNARDFEANGTDIVLNLSGVVFDNPAGDHQNYTNLSLNDLVASAYSIDWTNNASSLPLPPDSISFAQKYVNITPLSGTVSLDNVVWHWLQAEVIPPYNENQFRLMKFNSTWVNTGAALDTGANTLTLNNIGSFSDFAILQTTPSESDNPTEEPAEEGYDVRIKPACQGFIVTVKDGGTPVENALVTGTDETDAIELTPRYTNSSGQAFFPDCDIDVSVKAAKSGRQGTDSGMAACGFCPECATDDDCADSEQCSSQQCVPVNCPDGRVVNHACELYECVEDSDCPVGQSCIDHRCKTVYECTYGLANTTADDNADCADNEYCDVPVGQPGGSCKPITGCGDIRNHAITMWECGDLEGCPSCNAGELCITHKCVQGDLTCPASGIVGDSKTCQAKEDGLPCLNCDYVVTDPTGKNFTGQTDGKGNLNLPLKLAGNYKVTLLKDGQVVKTLLVKALPKSPPVEPEKPAAGGLDPLLGGLFLVILLALGLVAIMYWRRRKGEKRAGPKAPAKK